MVYVRRSRKATAKRSRRTYRKRRFNMVGRSKPYQTKFVRITRMSILDSTNNVHLTIQGSAAGNNIGSTVFKLSNVPGYGEIQSLFDNYCLRKVQYRWVCTRNPDTTTSVSVTDRRGIYPRITWVHDFNDSTPINRTQMQHHPRIKEYFFNDNTQKTKWYTLKAASLTTMFETGVATAYKPTWGAFVDTNDYDMAHYGLKWAYTDLFEGMNLYLEAKLTFDCKGIS